MFTSIEFHRNVCEFAWLPSDKMERRYFAAVALAASTIAISPSFTSLYIMRRHTDLKNIYGDAPAAVQSSAEYFLKQLRFVDVALSDGRQYLMGDRFTAADILLMTCLVWATNYRIGACDSARPYMDRIAARPAYQQAQIANRPIDTGCAGT